MTIPIRFCLPENVVRRRRVPVAVRLLGRTAIRVLGYGAYSTAFAIGRGKVLKITDARDDTVSWFARYLRRNHNPHWPRIHRQIRVGRTHVATWTERLHPLDRAARDRVSCVDDFVLNAGHDTAAHLEGLAEYGYGGPWQGCPKRLRQPLLGLRRAAEADGFVADAKREVFMRRRGGILVLADPFVPRTRRPTRARGNTVPDNDAVG